MTDLKTLIRQAERGQENIVTAPHARWLERPEEDRRYTEEAIEFVANALRGVGGHPRTGRFSPSQLGECPRRQLFGFHGAPRLDDEPDAYDLMGLGNWGHLKWQAEGLSEGWMTEAEVWTFNAELRFGGTMDGTLIDGSIFELKTTRSQLYTKYAMVEREPKLDHLLQFGGYSLMTEIQWGSVIYEDRNSGLFTEFRVQMSGKLEDKVMEILDDLNGHVDAGTLPPILEDCRRKTGQVYRRCPWREHCLTTYQAELGTSG